MINKLPKHTAQETFRPLFSPRLSCSSPSLDPLLLCFLFFILITLSTYAPLLTSPLPSLPPLHFSHLSILDPQRGGRVTLSRSTSSACFSLSASLSLCSAFNWLETDSQKLWLKNFFWIQTKNLKKNFEINKKNLKKTKSRSLDFLPFSHVGRFECIFRPAVIQLNTIAVRFLLPDLSVASIVFFSQPTEALKDL